VSKTKVVGFFTSNPTKLGLHFSDLSTVSYGFYKKTAKHIYYLSYSFSLGSLEILGVSQIYPYFAD
jgi:hypothetical protein